MACGGVRANEVFLLYLFKALFIAWTYPLAPSSYHVVQNKNIKHSTEGWSRTQNKSSSIKRNAHLDHKVKEIELFFSQWLVFRMAFLSKARFVLKWDSRSITQRHNNHKPKLLWKIRWLDSVHEKYGFFFNEIYYNIAHCGYKWIIILQKCGGIGFILKKINEFKYKRDKKILGVV